MVGHFVPLTHKGAQVRSWDPRSTVDQACSIFTISGDDVLPINMHSRRTSPERTCKSAASSHSDGVLLAIKLRYLLSLPYDKAHPEL